MKIGQSQKMIIIYSVVGILVLIGGYFVLDNILLSASEDIAIEEFRSALRCESPEAQLVPIIRSEYTYQFTDRIHECYPIAAVKYGIGYLILVGITLNKEKDLSLVISAINKIIEKLRENGSIE